MISPEACGDLSLACGSPPSERMDRLPWSACHLPRSVWMVALGARGSLPFVRVDGLPRSLGARGCALGHTDGLPQSQPGCQELWPNLWVHADAGTRITYEHKARGRQRAGATPRDAATSVRASLFQLCRRGLVSRVFTNPNYFRPPIIYQNK
jgi:hypothetical protein